MSECGYVLLSKCGHALVGMFYWMCFSECMWVCCFSDYDLADVFCEYILVFTMLKAT